MEGDKQMSRATLNKELEDIDNKVEKVSIAVLAIKSANRGKIFWFIAWLITFIGLLCSLCYICYLYDDIEEITTETIDIQDVENINDSQIKIGDDIWEELN